MPDQDVIRVIEAFVQSVVNEDRDEAWSDLVHNGRQNESVEDYLSRMRQIFEPMGLVFDEDGPGHGIEILRDQHEPFPNGPVRHIVQMKVRWSIRGVQKAKWKGIEPTGRQVFVPHVTVGLFIVDGRISGLEEYFTHDSEIEHALRSERDLFDDNAIAAAKKRDEEEFQRKTAESQRNAALRVALKDSQDRRRGGKH